MFSDPAGLSAFREAIEREGVEVLSSDLAMEPKSTIELDESEASSLLRLLDALEEQDDVDGVHANCDISDEVMEKALG